MDINKISYDEKIGQKFIFGINSNKIDEVIYLIKEYCIGGVILYRRNYKSYDDMLDVIVRLKNANKDNKIPLFIAIDQEWGIVNRFPKDIHNMKNIYAISKTDSDLVYDSAILTGEILNSVGINMNLAPVLDIYNSKKNSNNSYKRCFFGNIDEISHNGSIYIDGLKEKNVLAVCKHFPGNGITKIDSHFITPYIFDYKKILSNDVLPFISINNNSDAMMVGHLVIRKMTSLLPASISKKLIDNYLRGEIKFDGLVMTDEINMLNNNLLYRLIWLKKALMTSNDIILIKIKDKQQGISIMEKARKINIDSELLDDSVERIVKVKKKYNVSDGTTGLGFNVDKINNRIDDINNKVSR